MGYARGGRSAGGAAAAPLPMANIVVQGQERDTLWGGRRTPDRLLNTARQQARGPQAEDETRSGRGPGKSFLADTRRSDRGWVDGELQSPCFLGGGLPPPGQRHGRGGWLRGS